MEDENAEDIHHHHSQHILECTTLIVEASLIIIINITFLILLHRRRRSINWKSTGFVANVAVSDLLCSASLIATMGNILDLTSSSKEEILMEDAIQLVTTYSIFLTVVNYTALFFVQYFSVKKPIFYQTRCTRRIFIYVIIGQWLLVSVYVTIKAVIIKHDTAQFNLAVGELVLMALTTIFNIATYSYVLYVSSVQTMQKLARRQEKEQESRRSREKESVKERESEKRNEINQNGTEAETENQSEDQNENETDQKENQTHTKKEGQDQTQTETQNRIQNERKEKSFWTIAKPVLKILLIDYRVTVTAGLHLIVYVVTFMPMWLVSVLVASGAIPPSSHDHKLSTPLANIYACRSPACRVTFYIWYLRAIIDPLLQIARERQLSQELKEWVKKCRRLVRRRNDQNSMSSAQNSERGHTGHSEYENAKNITM